MSFVSCHKSNFRFKRFTPYFTMKSFFSLFFWKPREQIAFKNTFLFHFCPSAELFWWCKSLKIELSKIFIFRFFLVFAQIVFVLFSLIAYFQRYFPFYHVICCFLFRLISQRVSQSEKLFFSEWFHIIGCHSTCKSWIQSYPSWMNVTKSFFE